MLGTDCRRFRRRATAKLPFGVRHLTEDPFTAQRGFTHKALCRGSRGGSELTVPLACLRPLRAMLAPTACALVWFCFLCRHYAMFGVCSQAPLPSPLPIIVIIVFVVVIILIIVTIVIVIRIAISVSISLPSPSTSTSPSLSPSPPPPPSSPPPSSPPPSPSPPSPPSPGAMMRHEESK